MSSKLFLCALTATFVATAPQAVLAADKDPSEGTVKEKIARIEAKTKAAEDEKARVQAAVDKTKGKTKTEQTTEASDVSSQDAGEKKETLGSSGTTDAPPTPQETVDAKAPPPLILSPQIQPPHLPRPSKKLLPQRGK